MRKGKGNGGREGQILLYYTVYKEGSGGARRGREGGARLRHFPERRRRRLVDKRWEEERRNKAEKRNKKKRGIRGVPRSRFNKNESGGEGFFSSPAFFTIYIFLVQRKKMAEKHYSEPAIKCLGGEKLSSPVINARDILTQKRIFSVIQLVNIYEQKAFASPSGKFFHQHMSKKDERGS